MKIFIAHPEKDSFLQKENTENSIIIKDENTIIPVVYKVTDNGTCSNLKPKVELKKYTDCHVRFCEAQKNRSFYPGDNRYYELIGTHKGEENVITSGSIDWVRTNLVTTIDEAEEQYKYYLKCWDNHIDEIRARLFEDMQNKFNKLK